VRLTLKFKEIAQKSTVAIQKFWTGSSNMLYDCAISCLGSVSLLPTISDSNDKKVAPRVRNFRNTCSDAFNLDETTMTEYTWWRFALGSDGEALYPPLNADSQWNVNGMGSLERWNDSCTQTQVGLKDWGVKIRDHKKTGESILWQQAVLVYNAYLLIS